jgi:hypothetical protein
VRCDLAAIKMTIPAVVEKKKEVRERRFYSDVLLQARKEIFTAN